MIPHFFYKGRLSAMRAWLGEPSTFCAMPSCGAPVRDGTEYCSNACAEAHDTQLRGLAPEDRSRRTYESPWHPEGTD